MDVREMRNEALGKRVVKALESRNMDAYYAETKEEAVQKAREISESGDVVTLSPACASFDMYPNFEARGIHYKNLVKEL